MSDEDKNFRVSLILYFGNDWWRHVKTIDLHCNICFQNYNIL